LFQRRRVGRDVLLADEKRKLAKGLKEEKTVALEEDDP
jgi:hypothetical protein